MFTLKIDLGDFERGVSEAVTKQVPFALSQAINDAMYDGLEEVEDEIASVFDRPTRFTLKAFRVQRSSKRKLQASILRKDVVAGRHYLEVQEKGGTRGQTGLEKLMDARVAYDGVLRSVIPARGARLTQAGNWSPRQRNQVLSAIQAQRDTRSNTSAASRKRNSSRGAYFVPRSGSKLSPGVYQRMKRGKVKKIVHFSGKAPKYNRRFKFYERSLKRINQRLPAHFDRRLKAAMASSR